jgi:hypothetical protein
MCIIRLCEQSEAIQPTLKQSGLPRRSAPRKDDSPLTLPALGAFGVAQTRFLVQPRSLALAFYGLYRPRPCSAVGRHLWGQWRDRGLMIIADAAPFPMMRAIFLGRTEKRRHSALT